MKLLTDVNALFISIQAGITDIQIDVDNSYTLATHTFSPSLLIHFNLREMLKNMKRSMAQHPWLALLKNLDEDI